MRCLAVFLSLLLLAGCSVQQRRYQRGLHVELLRSDRGRHAAVKPGTPLHTGIVRESVISAQPDLVAAAGESSHAPVILKSIDRPSVAVPFKKPRRHLQSDPDTCDLIIMKNGQEIRARILEIGLKDIRYNKCDIGTAVHISHKSDIFMIRYANGSREVFNSTAESSSPKSASGTAKKEHPDTMLILILALLGWFIGIGSIP